MANIYSYADLLIGRTYSSKTISGKIVSAEKHSAFFGRGIEAYLIEIDTGMIRNKFRVVGVGDPDDVYADSFQVSAVSAIILLTNYERKTKWETYQK